MFWQILVSKKPTSCSRWPLSSVSSHGGRGKRALWNLFNKGTNPMLEGSSKVRISTYDFVEGHEYSVHNLPNCPENPWAQRCHLVYLTAISQFCGHMLCRSVMSNSLQPHNCSPPGSSAHGILQARILEWVAISFSRGSSQSRNQTGVSCIANRLFTVWATREVNSKNGFQIVFVTHAFL